MRSRSLLAGLSAVCGVRLPVPRPPCGLRGLTASMSGAPPARPPENAAGQDLGELFELMTPPEVVNAPLPAGTVARSLGVRKKRGDVHRDGDWHSSVHIWLTDDEGNLLMQKRSELKDTNPGMWDVSCAGHITAGDASLETAEKELQEELGIAMAQDALAEARLCTFAYTAKGSTARHGAYECNEYTDIFLVRCSTDALRPEQLELEAGEVEGVKLVPAKEVIRAWEANDPSYVPRTPAYGAVIRQGLSKVGF